MLKNRSNRTNASRGCKAVISVDKAADPTDGAGPDRLPGRRGQPQAVAPHARARDGARLLLHQGPEPQAHPRIRHRHSSCR